MRVTAKSKLMAVVLCWMLLGPLPKVIDKINVVHQSQEGYLEWASEIAITLSLINAMDHGG